MAKRRKQKRQDRTVRDAQYRAAFGLVNGQPLPHQLGHAGVPGVPVQVTAKRPYRGRRSRGSLAHCSGTCPRCGQVFRAGRDRVVGTTTGQLAHAECPVVVRRIEDVDGGR